MAALLSSKTAARAGCARPSNCLFDAIAAALPRQAFLLIVANLDVFATYRHFLANPHNIK
jgi:hypothetical protein